MFVIRFVINVLALLAVFLVIWQVHGDNVVLIAIVMAVVLAVINVVIRPILLLLTLPLSLVTFGLFGVVLNAVLFYFAARLVHINVDFCDAGPAASPEATPTAAAPAAPTADAGAAPGPTASSEPTPIPDAAPVTSATLPANLAVMNDPSRPMLR